jgi:hypothetical protein
VEARNSGHRIRGLSDCEEAALGVGIKARCDGLLRFHLWQGIFISAHGAPVVKNAMLACNLTTGALPVSLNQTIELDQRKLARRVKVSRGRCSW